MIVCTSGDVLILLNARDSFGANSTAFVFSIILWESARGESHYRSDIL